MHHPAPEKKKRLQNSCDECRRKKGLFSYPIFFQKKCPHPNCKQFGVSQLYSYAIAILQILKASPLELGDSERMPYNLCSSCLNAGIPCTHQKMHQVRVDVEIFPVAETFLLSSYLFRNADLNQGTSSNGIRSSSFLIAGFSWIGPSAQMP
jgi:hypothetical protein